MSAPAFVPTRAFLTRGAGTGLHRLEAFDAALREAGISSQNLVPVSSVFPPACALVSREEGIRMLSPGQITFCVMARHESAEAGARIGAGLGLVIPAAPAQYGYLAEHHAVGQDEETVAADAGVIAERLLAAKLGIAVDGLRVGRRETIAQAATVRADGSTTAVVAVCVFVL